METALFFSFLLLFHFCQPKKNNLLEFVVALGTRMSCYLNLQRLPMQMCDSMSKLVAFFFHLLSCMQECVLMFSVTVE